MAETAKVLCPDKKVLIPCPEAGCSLADSCDAGAFAAFRAQHPDHTVVSYVNTTVEVKALTDICCTSSNALKVVESIPADRPVIFARTATWAPTSGSSPGGKTCSSGTGRATCTRSSRSKAARAQARTPRGEGRGASRMPGLHRRRGRLRGFHGGNPLLLRTERRAGVHRRDRGGNPRGDAPPPSGEALHPGASRRRDMRLQQLPLHEDGDAGEHRRGARDARPRSCSTSGSAASPSGPYGI